MKKFFIFSLVAFLVTLGLCSLTKWSFWTIFVFLETGYGLYALHATHPRLAKWTAGLMAVALIGIWVYSWLEKNLPLSRQALPYAKNWQDARLARIMDPGLSKARSVLISELQNKENELAATIPSLMKAGKYQEMATNTQELIRLRQEIDKLLAQIAVPPPPLATSTSFAVAKTNVSFFCRWNGTNMSWDQAITNQLRQGDKVVMLRPEEEPMMFEGQAFIEVVLSNTNDTFVGGTKVWVEAWKFDWSNGNKAIATPKVDSEQKAWAEKKITLKRGDKLTYKLGLNEATPWIEVPRGVVYNISDKNFRVFFSNGHPPIDVGEKDVIFPDVSPTIIRVGSLVPDNNIEITGM